MKKKVVFIINPHSGVRPKGAIEEEINKFINKDLIDFELHYTEYAGHANELSLKYRDTVDCVVAVGGDGTVNEVGRGLINSGTAMGIIPSGSGNGLARDLDIPLRSTLAIEVLNETETRYIDVMKVNDHFSLNMAGVGFDAYISHKFAKVKTRGPLQYVNLIGREFPRYTTKEYSLSIDGHIFVRKAFFISFANSTQWGNDVHIAPQAQIDDGIIDVCVINEFPDIAIPALLTHLLSKNIEKNKYDEIIKGREIEIFNKRSIRGHVDGEPIMLPPHSKISVLPLSLKVVVPPPDFYQSTRFSPGDIKDFIENNLPLPIPISDLPRPQVFDKITEQIKKLK